MIKEPTCSAISIVVPEKDQLPPSLLSNIETGFKSAFEQAEKWRTQALSIQVTSLDQKAEMKLARTIRLELKAVRVSADKARKALKADALLMGRAIDGVYNLLEAAIIPMERHLDDQEKFAERLAEAERLRIKAEREAALASFLTEGQQVPAVEVMTQDQWASYLADVKLLAEAKIEAAAKAEAERIAKEQAEAAERERQRIELERLRKEAVEREAAAKAEREAAEKAQREAAAKAKAERDALEAAAKAEREAAERELARIKAEAESAAKKEREERARLEAELAAKKAAEAKAAADADAAQKKAARAPDKQKALTFAATVRTLKTPEATTAEGKSVMAEITAKIEGFAKWIETQASSL